VVGGEKGNEKGEEGVMRPHRGRFHPKIAKGKVPGRGAPFGEGGGEVLGCGRGGFWIFRREKPNPWRIPSI